MTNSTVYAFIFKLGLEAVRISARILQRGTELGLSQKRRVSSAARAGRIRHVPVPSDSRPVPYQPRRRHARKHRVLHQDGLRICNSQSNFS